MKRERNRRSRCRSPSRRSSRAGALIAVVALAIAGRAWGADVWERGWVEARSPHFVILSTMKRDRAVEFARELESFRAALELVMGTGVVQDRVPTIICLLPPGIKGFDNFFRDHYSLMRANYLAVVDSERWRVPLAKHQIVHVMILNSAPFGYPVWLDEGLARLFGTTRVDGDVVEYAKPSGFWERTSGGWMTFDDLLEVRDDSKLPRSTGVWNQSWGLTHYLMYGRRGRDFDTDRRAFFDLIQSGVAQTDSFERAYGVRIVALRSELSRYVSGGLQYFRLALTDGPREVRTTVSDVAPDRVASMLGTLAFFRQRTDAAKRFWDAAIALNPDNADAVARLGDLHSSAGRFDEAQTYYEKAIALEPQNPYHELDYGESFLDRATGAADSAQISSALTEARKHFARSVALDPRIPETFAMNGSTYLFPGESADAAVEAVQTAHAMLPTHPRINLLLAKAFLASGATDKSARLLRLLVTQPDTQEGEADALLRRINAESSTSALHTQSTE